MTKKYCDMKHRLLFFFFLWNEELLADAYHYVSTKRIMPLSLVKVCWGAMICSAGVYLLIDNVILSLLLLAIGLRSIYPCHERWMRYKIIWSERNDVINELDGWLSTERRHKKLQVHQYSLAIQARDLYRSDMVHYLSYLDYTENELMRKDDAEIEILFYEYCREAIEHVFVLKTQIIELQDTRYRLNDFVNIYEYY